jgi:hypothetical protein
MAGAAAAAFAAWNLHPFLAQNAPAGARLLVVEGWMEPEGFDQAIAVFRANGYERIVTTGGPVPPWPVPPVPTTYAQLAADYLTRHGIAAAQVTAVPAPESAERHTYLSAVMVREWARRSALKLDALDVYSSGTHARRSRLLYERAFGPQVRVGVYAARSSDYDPGAWWQTTFGVRDVVTQAAGLAWVTCCFRPPPALQAPP